MTAVSVFREDIENAGARFAAVTASGDIHAVGRTPGEAIDALMSQLDKNENHSIVIVLQQETENVFTEAQVSRLRELIAISKTTSLTANEQAEMEDLINAELRASAQFASSLADALGR